MKKLFRNSLISLSLLTVTACGFHLRNTASMPSALAPIYIGGPAGNSALGHALRYHLTNSNTSVTPYSAQAAYHLIILSEAQDQRIISIDRRGLAAEYGITTSVDFELHDKQNRRVLGPQHIEERRTITNNPDNALTTSKDVGIVRADMEQVLAAQVVRRLAAYATHKLPAAEIQPTPTTPITTPTPTTTTTTDNAAQTSESPNSDAPQTPAQTH